ncbi:MAG TPA: hypothetical protein VKA51_08300, partial [Rubrobacteraceae bacterium]|nr:hypothetical protein [Rubrobacteraceae bacterium]
EKTSTLREGIGRLTLEAGLDQIEGRRPRLEASGVPEPEPVGYGLARLEGRLEALAGLLEHEGQRLADAQR